MTEHEFEERLRREYRAAASSWTPEKETERALLDKLETAAPHRSAARFLRPAAALCCCAALAAAALFTLQTRPTAEDSAAVAEDVSSSQSSAAFAAAAAGNDAETDTAAEAAQADAAQESNSAEEADQQEAAPKEADPSLAAAMPEMFTADAPDNGSSLQMQNRSAASMTADEARAVPTLGELLPGPQTGLETETAYQEETENGTELVLLCTGDNAEFSVRVTAASQDQLSRVVNASEPETYDLTLYAAPLSETVPEELLSCVENPVFRAEELSETLLEARVDSETGGMRFGVLCGEAVAEYDCSGMTPQQAYAAVTSAAYFAEK